jgi:hypothetical protein
MILLGVNVQNRDADIPQIHSLLANLDLTFNQFVSLVKVLHELSVSFPSLVRTIENPLFHSEKVD